ncbi:MAG: cohesin domain-containing protein, partial [Patescibacteria group bacterium]
MEEKTKSIIRFRWHGWRHFCIPRLGGAGVGWRNLVFFLFSIFYFLNPSSAHAASLYFSPSSGSKQVGTTFTVSVFVSSADQAMNAASGVLSMSSDLLQVVSISKAGSIFSLWAQEPSFTASSVNFEGIVLNPGYTGSSGKLLTITLKAKAVGEAALSFSGGSVLANDGSGTNILTGMGSANFALNVKSLAPAAGQSTSPLEAAGVPTAPRIYSSTNPDSEKWYANSNPKFSWTMGPDITGVSIFGDHDSNTNPGSTSDGLFSNKTYNSVEDGVWYFHLRLRNRYGWGAISHFKFRIDTARPSSFDIVKVEGADDTNPAVSFLLKATDELSGVDYYEMQVD